MKNTVGKNSMQNNLSRRMNMQAGRQNSGNHWSWTEKRIKKKQGQFKRTQGQHKAV